jgi:hypothetical protein
MAVICPTSQASKKERHSREFNCRSSETSVGNRTKPKVVVGKHRIEKARDLRGPRADFSNDGYMPVICPSLQVFFIHT